MIVYDVTCANGHVFEGWFRDSAAFDKQAKARKIVCPSCGDTKVRKAPMAPRLAKGEAAAPAPAPEKMVTPPALPAEAVRALRALRRHVEENADHVGERFAEEARKIHYGETDRRSIYGEATREESAALAEEGVEFHRIPWLPRHDA